MWRVQVAVLWAEHDHMELLSIMHVTGTFHTHDPQHTVFRRDVEVNLTIIATPLRAEGGMSHKHI